ncbi:hypothetical protein BC832DRAFT_222295 [Gaertneriomyces semiglobifer]|nr:hypothetical protein BC832DRAFT_222295 [Gaertneriomyces semiglobifer]
MVELKDIERQERGFMVIYFSSPYTSTLGRWFCHNGFVQRAASWNRYCYCLLFAVTNCFFVNLNASGCLDPAHFLAAPIRNLPRLFGNQFLHGGLLHLAFNAVPFAGLGKQLERNVGSFQFMHLIFILTLIGSLIHVLLGAVVGLFASSWAGCSVGLGGLIFAFFTIEANTESRIFTPRRIASWTIPGAVYPFIALIIIAVLTAGASFLSHLAGILAGEFCEYAACR